MTVTPGDGPDRRLFVNGEALRVTVEPAPGGGGQKYEPFTAIEAAGVLLPQIEQARTSLSNLPEEARAPGRVYVEAQLLPNYISASDFPEDLLNYIGAVPVGSRQAAGEYTTAKLTREAPTRRLILAVPDDGLAQLQQLVGAAGGRTRSDRSAFEDIKKLSHFSMPAPDDVVVAEMLGDEEPRMCEAVLHPSTAINGEPVALDPETMDRWTTFVASRGGEIVTEYIREVAGLTFVPVFLLPSQMREIAVFNPLRGIRPMPAIRPRPGFGTRSGNQLIPPASAATTASAPRVAVFDGGVDTSSGSPGPYFPIPVADLTPEPPDPGDTDHGTGVTGAVLYGLVRPGEQAPEIPLPVESFRVFPAPVVSGDLYGYWILDQIKDVVEEGDHKIVNLSLGPELAVEESDVPNRWTSELDRLAWEYDVLFVVAAGNTGARASHVGLDRVQVPADMVNGLSVGACDEAPPDAPWARAPYSSIGPGRAGCRAQPTGVQFGGEGGSGKLFPVLRADGTFLEASGTSFSAPVHTHALAELAAKLPRSNPSVLRAFSAHFAERPRSRAQQLFPEVGHGRFPLSFEDVLDCAADDMHVLYVDEVNRGELIGYQLPVPPTAGGNRLELRVTLAYSTPVEPTQPSEYTQSSIEMVLRPHALIHGFSPPPEVQGQRTNLDITSAEANRLRTEGWIESQEPVSKPLKASGRSELDLRDAGKWETMRHYRLNFGAGTVHAPRLDISYLARRAGKLESGAPTIPYAVLVSVVDRDASGTLYDSASAQFNALRVLPRQTARVRLRAGTRLDRWY